MQSSDNVPAGLKSSPLMLKRVIPLVMGLATAGVLLASVPSREAIAEGTVAALIYALLTGFALFFGVWLTQGALSPAHIIGVVAFLSQGEAQQPVMTWAVAIGGLGGAVVAAFYRRHLAVDGHWFNPAQVVMTVARVTLSLFAASQVYIALGGALPLDRAAWADGITPLALPVFVLVNITVYLAIFALEAYVRAYRLPHLFRDNLALMLVVVVLPMPFALLSAQVARDLSQPADAIGVFGLAVIIVGLHALSRSEHAVRRQLADMTALAAAARSMRSHMTLDAVLETLHRQITATLPVQDVTLLIHDPDDDKATQDGLIMRYGQRLPFSAQAVSGLDDHALVDLVRRTGSRLLLLDSVAAGAAKLGLQGVPPDLVSWLGLPLQAGHRTFGLMAVAVRRPGRPLQRSDRHLLSIMADSASIAVENAHLFRQQRQQVERLTTLNHIAALLSGTLSPETVQDTVLSSASALTQANAVSLHLVPRQGALPVLTRYAGFDERFARKLPLPMLVDDLFSSDAEPAAVLPAVLGDLQASPRGAARRALLMAQGIAAFIELPLVRDDEAMGLLTLYFSTPQHIDDEQIVLYRTFATQASQAIHNARTFATTDQAFQRTVDQLLTLAAVGGQLTATMDLTRIGELVLQHVCGRFGQAGADVTAGIVALKAARGNGLEIVAHRLPDGQVTDPTVLTAAIASAALQSGKPQVMTADDDEDLPGWPVPGVRSQLAAPIMRGDEMLGLILLASDSDATFSEEDQQFVHQIGNQAVVAVENARLFRRVAEARDRLLVLLRAMEEAIVLIDSRGQVALANPRIDALGLDPDALIGRPVADLLAEGVPLASCFGFDDDSDLRRLLAAIGTRQDWPAPRPHLYVRHQGADTRYFQRVITPIQDEDGQVSGALLVFYDQTDEQELSRARDELTRMIVHDLRSPLTAVVTGLKLLQDYVPAENDAYQLVQNTTTTSRRAVRKLLARVNSLLDISKMQSGRLEIEREVVPLDTVFGIVQEELSPLAGELDIDIVPELPATLPPLDVDQDKVERLLLNLVDNALKYSPPGSRVIVRAHAPGTVGAADGYLRLDVTDTGPGIPDDYKQSLFDSYVQVAGREKVRHGVGLGLAFCRLVADAHGGRIWVEDNAPQGSVFAVTLPVITALPPQG